MVGIVRLAGRFYPFYTKIMHFFIKYLEIGFLFLSRTTRAVFYIFLTCCVFE